MFKNLNSNNNSIHIIISILLTIGGFISLSIGNLIFCKKANYSILNEILVYIIPFFYIIIVKYILKKFNFINCTFLNKKPKFAFFKTFFLGILFMIIPIYLSFSENVLNFLNKKPITNYKIIFLQLLILSFFIGIFEENLFRNIIFKVLLKNHSKKSFLLSFYISSILFGMLHLGNLTISLKTPITVFTQIIYATFLGMLLSALYIKYQSLLGIITLHGFIDLISFFPKLFNNTNVNLADITLKESFITIAILLPSGIIGIVLMHKYIKKQIKKL